MHGSLTLEATHRGVEINDHFNVVQTVQKEVTLLRRQSLILGILEETC